MESKIFIVITVIGVIFIGLTIWLFKLDRKITKLEKEQQKNIND
jgi:plastocyanin domain-containing protein